MALTMTSTALALSCAYPVEVATLALDTAMFGDEPTADELGIASVEAAYLGRVVLVFDMADGTSLPVGFDAVDGAP